MGDGLYSGEAHRVRATARKTHTSAQQSFKQSNVHPDMNPKGVRVRESRDSEEHPDSNAILMFLDITGSMDRVLTEISKTQLVKFMEILHTNAVIPHPQVLVGACGDAQNGYREQGPLQVGQFESDIRIDDDMQKVFFERMGGCNAGETYLLPMWWAAKHTSIDCWEKRGRKGYLFTIGDEPFLPTLTKREVKQYLGDDIPETLSAEEVLALAREQYHVFHVNIASTGAGSRSHTHRVWERFLGPHFLNLSTHTAVCEAMAAAIALTEGVMDANDLAAELESLRFSQDTIAPVTRAITPYVQFLKAQGQEQNQGEAQRGADPSGTHRW